MCWKMSMPSVSTTARDLVPSTESKTPDSPVFGDNTEDTTRKKGMQALKINFNKDNKMKTGSDTDTTNWYGY